MTATRRDVRASLEAVGRRPAPLPRPDFVAGLEARLMAMDRSVEAPADEGDVAPVVALHRPVRGRRITVLVGAAAAAIAALVLAGSLGGWFGGGADGGNVKLTDATDTKVKLPDGSSVEGQEGADLPDGAVVSTGPDGSATAGGVEIGPGQQATVENGKVLPPVTVPALPDVTVPTVPSVPSVPLP